MEAKELEKNSQLKEKEKTKVYLILASSAFILLWTSSMKWISYFDGLIFFILVFLASMGIIRGGIKEFFGFFGAFASLLLAIFSYRFLATKINLALGINDALWTELLCFIFLLAACWTICYLLNHYLQKKVEKASGLKIFNRFVGFLLGILKGLILAYVIITVVDFTGFSSRDKEWEKQYMASYGAHLINILENRYHILDNLAKMELAKKLNNMHMKIRIQEVAFSLFPEEKDLQDKTIKFLLWISQDSSILQNFVKSKESKRVYQEFLEIKEAKKFWDTDPEIQKLKLLSQIGIVEICEILKMSSSKDLAKNSGIKSLLKSADLEKIQLEMK